MQRERQTDRRRDRQRERERQRQRKGGREVEREGGGRRGEKKIPLLPQAMSAEQCLKKASIFYFWKERKKSKRGY